ncbi:MAG: PEP-CTERM sorting domain-containing protein [Microbacteriaceae bacterium]|nr:PEP-CTERM sorting domain-containing protein [Burkholderiaceae bacterium]
MFGLSDDGQHLSSRWVDAASVASPANTALRISGQSAVIAVPEPGAAWMLAGGLVLVGAVIRRRRQR